MKKNCAAVSEVMEEALLTCIVVLMLGAISLFVFSNSENPPEIPHSDIEGWVNTSLDILYIRHCGGESIDVEDMNIIVTINGDKRTDSSENISAVLGGRNCWEMGDFIEINTSGRWGIAINEGDIMQVYVVNKESKQIIQKISLAPVP